MKKTVVFLMIIALSVGSMSSAFAQKKEKNQNKEEVTAVFTLDEEICHNCKRKIDGYIPFEKGVTALAYGEDGSTVEVTFRSDRTDTLKLQKAFDKIKLAVVETSVEEHQKK